MKMESLVIAGQLHSGELFPGLVHTARHTTGAGYTRNRVSFYGDTSKVGLVTRVKS